MTPHADTVSGRGRTRPSTLGVAGGVTLATLGVLGYAVTSGSARFDEIGDAYPGVFTSTAEFVGHFAATLAGAVCLGALVFIVTTARPDDDGRLDPSTFRVHLWLERCSLAWVALATAMVFIDASSTSGTSIGRLLLSPVIADAVAASESARGWCAAAIFAAGVALGARITIRWMGHALLLAPAILGVIAVPVTGNAGQGPDHDQSTSLVIVWAVALAVLTGIKVVMASAPRATPATAARMQWLCSVAGAVVLGYGVILGALLVHGNPFASDYGRLGVFAGALVLVVWTLDTAELRWTASASRLRATCTAVAMVMAVAAVSAMAVQTPPRFLEHRFTAWDVFLGYELPEPPGVFTLLTVWRFDPLIGTGAALLALAYLAAAVRLRRRGDQWPIGRTIAWMVGCAAWLFVTSSGVRAYGSAMFSVHMSEHMALNMFIPVMLVLGAPLTLALRVLPAAPDGATPGPREWLMWVVHSSATRFIANPITAFVLFVGSLYAVYFTPVFDTLVRYHWGHEFMSVHFLLTGYLFFWVIIGIDPGPRRLPFLARLGLLFAVMPFHAFFGIATMTMTSTLGGYFYPSVDLPWLSSIAADQNLGGAIAWGSSELPVIIVVVALVTQWARHDRRAGTRYDRHADAGFDDDLDAYNAMLREFAQGRGQ